MKKILSFLAMAVILAACLACLVACQASPLEKAAKNADNYQIVCALDVENHQLSAVQTVNVTNRSENSFSAVKFHVYANQYRQDAKKGVVPAAYKAVAYPNGDSFGEICFDSVKVDGKPVAFCIEGEDLDVLSVPTGEELFPQQSVTVEMTYVVTLANVRHRLGWTENAVNLGNFFPILCWVQNGAYCTTPYYNVGDPFVSEVANFDVTLKIDENYVVASSGNLKEAENANGIATYRYQAKAVRDFAFVCSNKYQKISQTVDGTIVNYYYFADNDSAASLATAVGAFEYYCKNVGNYPYSQLSVCETDFCYGGMEYPSLVMVTSGTPAYQEALAHEVAHQWFYGVVGNDQIENPWMDEGLAEFLTYLYLDNAGVAKLSKNVLANTRTYTTFVDVLNNYYDHVDTTFRSVAEFRNDNEYVVMTYVKGSLMFNTLYETMGQTKFFAALKRYYNSAAFTVATPGQMADCFVAVGGKELGNVFSAFAEGKEILGKVTD